MTDNLLFPMCVNLQIYFHIGADLRNALINTYIFTPSYLPIYLPTYWPKSIHRTLRPSRMYQNKDEETESTWLSSFGSWLLTTPDYDARGIRVQFSIIDF